MVRVPRHAAWSYPCSSAVLRGTIRSRPWPCYLKNPLRGPSCDNLYPAGLKLTSPLFSPYLFPFTFVPSQTTHCVDRLFDMDKSPEYSVEANEVPDEGTVLGEKTGTLADRDAMARLGKEQLFKVCCDTDGCPELHLTRCAAQLWLSVDFWLCFDYYGHLGGFPGHCGIRFRKWWSRRAHLHLHRCLYRFHLDFSLYGRDGLNGTYLRHVLRH